MTSFDSSANAAKQPSSHKKAEESESEGMFDLFLLPCKLLTACTGPMPCLPKSSNSNTAIHMSRDYHRGLEHGRVLEASLNRERSRLAMELRQQKRPNVHISTPPAREPSSAIPRTSLSENERTHGKPQDHGTDPSISSPTDQSNNSLEKTDSFIEKAKLEKASSLKKTSSMDKSKGATMYTPKENEQKKVEEPKKVPIFQLKSRPKHPPNGISMRFKKSAPM